MAEIYGLHDPDSGELRYVGKATSANERLKRHLNESRMLKRPVNNWIRKLLEAGKVPRVSIIETVADADWKTAEIRWIAEHRKSGRLLNVADGGDRPSQTPEQRVRAAKAANKVIAQQDPRWRRLWQAKQQMSRLATQERKDGDIFGYWCLRIRMHRRAESRPDLFGDWYLPWFAERLA